MKYRPVRDKKGQMRKVFCGCNDDWTPLTTLKTKAKEEDLIALQPWMRLGHRREKRLRIRMEGLREQ